LQEDSIIKANEPEDVRCLEEPRRPPPQPRSTSSERKRSRDSTAKPEHLEVVRPPKRPRRTSPSKQELSEDNLQEDFVAKADEPEGVHRSEEPQELLPSKDKLSKENLQRLEILSREDMEPTNSLPALKRTSSRRSIVASSEAGTDRSQRSSNATAVYRHKHLAAAEIHIHAEPPDCIEAAIDRIINRPVSDERQVELIVISQELRNGCLKNVRAQAGEDDFIDPLHTALKALGLMNLCLHEKADWREELKPVVPKQSHFSLSFMAGV